MDAIYLCTKRTPAANPRLPSSIFRCNRERNKPSSAYFSRGTYLASMKYENQRSSQCSEPPRHACSHQGLHHWMVATQHYFSKPRLRCPALVHYNNALRVNAHTTVYTPPACARVCCLTDNATILLGEYMAFLASGSDPTVMHCCKIANGEEQVVSRFLHRSPVRYGSWFFHTLEACTIRVQCLDKRALILSVTS